MTGYFRGTAVIVREAKVTTEREAIVADLKAAGFECARVGLRQGPVAMDRDRLA